MNTLMEWGVASALLLPFYAVAFDVLLTPAALPLAAVVAAIGCLALGTGAVVVVAATALDRLFSGSDAEPIETPIHGKYLGTHDRERENKTASESESGPSTGTPTLPDDVSEDDPIDLL